MANPVGEDSWLAYLDESARNISDLEQRVNVVEIYKRAVIAEPGSLRVWLGYCNYVWSLWADSHSGDAGWSEEEQMIGRELFSFNTALGLWQQGYEAIKYRLSDSHVFWDRWVSLELELLGETGTPEGIKRITHLYRDRLMTPHLTWDDTAQMYSSFLSEHNRAGWEESMKDITARSQDAKRLVAERDPYELRLQQAVRADDMEAQKTVMTEYLDWEMIQSELRTEDVQLGVDLCHGLFDRALTGLFSVDEAMWHEYFAFLSSSYTDSNASEKLLTAIRRAVQHCPWSGRLWSRYILCAEEARLDFAEVESIKHAATSENQLYKNGMESLLEMYVAWCGFLKRTAMDPSASDEAVDVADVGLTAALEDVEVVGQRLYGKEFQGDPKFRLERIYIQYLTEKKGAIDAARAKWNKLASVQIHANSYDFWFRFYIWEMFIFVSTNLANPIHGSPLTSASSRVPTLATAVLHRAATRMALDWPEKVLEVYMQHCNDYEPSTSMRRAAGLIHKLEKLVAKRRAAEQQEKAAAFAAYYGAQEADPHPDECDENPPSAQKRKRETAPETQNEDEDENSKKRQKSAQDPGESQAELKRDRENTTVVVANLPREVTQTKLRQYFKEFGHLNSIPAFRREDDDQSVIAMIEFSSAEEARSALLRDQKFFGQSQISVQSGHDLTVYVANYPPTADEKYIRDLFKSCGEILSIRWPSLKVNVHRRFCYVSFRDRDASARAVAKDGITIGGSYKLLAKYSDPGHKKNREGPVAEGREVHISGLNTAATEDELRSIFSKFGNVTRINIPRNMSGKGRGFAFVVFETREEAEESASELNNTKFLNQILHVEISKHSKVKPSAQNAVHAPSASPSQSPAPTGGAEAMDIVADGRASNPTSAEIASRTIALLGLPDTVNDARVRSLVEPLGAIVKLVLQPSRGGAKIEFADSGTAGRASLQLDNLEFEGRKLRVGSLEELRHARAERTQDRIVYGAKAQKQNDPAPKNAARSLLPQTTVRRPAPGKPGPKRGLGFLPSRTTPKTQGDASNAGLGGDEAADQKAEGSKQKSNAQFRTLLLTGSFVKGGEGSSS
ncbi:putative RNA-binding protein [Escovopsis weberi]|uniref:U4/U6 snRNA-associated-splicing factor PRP24 n=1 Tax=Escovopsis weberi TaxID=150374 RepID=A0A0M8N644_ESCWE|nr:putative RNA-binding protein [Escovopsis weberi]